MAKNLKSHAGTNGCQVLSANYVDETGREWPKGTAFRPASRGSVTVERDGKPVSVTRQTVIIESSHYQNVITDGFGEKVSFILDEV